MKMATVTKYCQRLSAGHMGSRGCLTGHEGGDGGQE